MSSSKIRREDIEVTSKSVDDWKLGNGLSERQAQKLFVGIGISEPPLELVDELIKASRDYVLTSWGFTVLPLTVAEQRKALNKVRAAAQQMELALELLLSSSTNVSEEVEQIRRKISRDDLIDLQSACDAAIRDTPKSGPAPKVDRLKFVQAIASIFQAATKEKPTRSKDETNNPNGKFHNFVVDTFAALKSPEWQGIDDVIKTVVKSRG